MVKSHTASGVPPGLHVTWAELLSKVPRTVTVACRPGAIVTDEAPTGASRMAAPVSSRELSSAVRTVVAVRPVLRTCSWIVAGVDGGGFPGVGMIGLVESCCGPSAR